MKLVSGMKLATARRKSMAGKSAREPVLPALPKSACRMLQAYRPTGG
jgi:hypothetical protein